MPLSRYSRDVPIWVPSIDNTELFVLLACVAFCAGGARMEQRSPLVWGGLSLGSWILFTQVLFGGMAWGSHRSAYSSRP